MKCETLTAPIEKQVHAAFYPYTSKHKTMKLEFLISMKTWMVLCFTKLYVLCNFPFIEEISEGRR